MKIYKNEEAKKAMDYIARVSDFNRQKIEFSSVLIDKNEVVLKITFDDGTDDISDYRDEKTGIVRKFLYVALPYSWEYEIYKDNEYDIEVTLLGWTNNERMNFNSDLFMEISEKIECAILNKLTDKNKIQ